MVRLTASAEEWGDGDSRVPPTPVIVANDELAAGGYWRFYMDLVWADAAVDVGGGVQHVCKENHNGNRSDHQMSWVEY